MQQKSINLNSRCILLPSAENKGTIVLAGRSCYIQQPEHFSVVAFCCIQQGVCEIPMGLGLTLSTLNRRCCTQQASQWWTLLHLQIAGCLASYWRWLGLIKETFCQWKKTQSKRSYQEQKMLSCSSLSHVAQYLQSMSINCHNHTQRTHLKGQYHHGQSRLSTRHGIGVLV